MLATRLKDLEISAVLYIYSSEKLKIVWKWIHSVHPSEIFSEIFIWFVQNVLNIISPENNDREKNWHHSTINLPMIKGKKIEKMVLGKSMVIIFEKSWTLFCVCS